MQQSFSSNFGMNNLLFFVLRKTIYSRLDILSLAISFFYWKSNFLFSIGASIPPPVETETPKEPSAEPEAKEKVSGFSCSYLFILLFTFFELKVIF